MRLTTEEKSILRALRRWNAPDDVELVPASLGRYVKIPYLPCKESELIPTLDALVSKGFAELRAEGYVSK